MSLDSDGLPHIYVKGAPEALLAMCAQQRTPEGNAPLDADYWLQQVEKLAEKGRRVLAVAERAAAAGQTALSSADIAQSLQFIGLVGLIDPPRAEAVAAVQQCREAGIQVKMITGDHAGTARAIGIEMGLGNSETLTVLTGADIESASDEALEQMAQNCDIFARTSPEHNPIRPYPTCFESLMPRGVRLFCFQGRSDQTGAIVPIPPFSALPAKPAPTSPHRTSSR